MAITSVATAVPTGKRPRASLAIFDVEATLDADTTIAIAHGLRVVPETYWFVELLAAAYLSQWTITTVDATNITLVKGTGVGSGAAGAQLRLFVARPQSVTR